MWHYAIHMSLLTFSCHIRKITNRTDTRSPILMGINKSNKWWNIAKETNGEKWGHGTQERNRECKDMVVTKLFNSHMSSSFFKGTH